MSVLADPNRREFLKAATLGAAGLVVGFYVPAGRRFAHAAEAPAAPAAPPLPQANAFLRIAPDDTVTVLLAHSEMGQGIWTSLPMLIAEELDFDVSRMKVEHAPAAPAYFHTAFGSQMTGGSTTTWSEFDRYRQVGAIARALLVQAAAQRLGVDPAACRTENGAVIAGAQRCERDRHRLGRPPRLDDRVPASGQARIDSEHPARPHRRPGRGTVGEHRFVP